MSLPAVPARIEAFDVDLAGAILAGLKAGDPSAMAWAHKIARFVHAHRAWLGPRARARFGPGYRRVLGAMAEVLAFAAAAGQQPDLTLLNAALWAQDSAGAEAPAQRAADEVLQRALREGAAGPGDAPASGPPPPTIQADPFTVVVFCPQPRSLYTLTTLALLLEAGVAVRAVVIRKLGVKRLAHELRTDGLKLLRKVWRKLILQSSENPGVAAETLLTLARRLGVAGCGVAAFARRHGIPVRHVEDFNDARTLAALQQAAPACVVFTGGGLIGDAVLAAAGLGVINCHMGVLPLYKGMDVVEWPLLEGRADCVGATTHFMARGVDTGPVLAGLRLDPAGFTSVPALRNDIERRMPGLMRDTVIGLRDGSLRAQPQPEAGRQYFRIHPRLRQILPDALRRSARPAGRPPGGTGRPPGGTGRPDSS